MNPVVTGRRKRNVGDKMTATDWHRMSDIVTDDMRMTETGMIDTGTTTTIAMSAMTENTPPNTIDARSSKVPTTTGPDKVTSTKNVSNQNVMQGMRIVGS